jgi:hypothetical protein
MKLGWSEWDDQVIKTYMYPYDAEEVMKIRLSEHDDDDLHAWHYERSGMFTI